MPNFALAFMGVVESSVDFKTKTATRRLPAVVVAKEAVMSKRRKI